MTVAKQGDTLPPTTAVCLDALERIVDLSTADSVEFHAVERRGLAAISATANLPNDGSDGKADYTWTIADRSQPGTYRWEFQATWTAETPEDEDLILTFPNDGYNELTIYPQLDTAAS